MTGFPPGSQAAEDEAFAVLEDYLTTRLLPQYAKEISDLLATEKGRAFMKGCAANGFGDAETKRFIENLLILQGKVTPERAMAGDR